MSDDEGETLEALDARRAAVDASQDPAFRAFVEFCVPFIRERDGAAKPPHALAAGTIAPRKPAARGLA